MNKIKLILHFVGIWLLDGIIGAVIILALNGLLYLLFGTPIAPLWIVGVACFGFSMGRILYMFLFHHWVVARVDDGYMVFDMDRIIEALEEEEE